MKRWMTLFVSLLLMGCPEHPVSEDTDAKLCPGGGENVDLPSGRELCVYQWPIVIETGFSCPAHRSMQFDVPEHFATCSSFGRPTDIELDFIFREFGVPDRASGWVGANDRTNSSMPVDILWVIDNSGSMCQEQQLLRESFGQFVTEITRYTNDFHVGITTTDTNADYPLEPLARPGRLQATPQPVPGFDRSCHTAVDASGAAIPGDYSPIRDNIRVAVDCMTEPDNSYLNVTNADIECALYNQPQGCEIPNVCGSVEPCTAEDLFPPSTSYRTIPKVLRSVDYIAEGTLNTERLQADFACASLVGTRGYGIEKGLEAAVLAVSPELTLGDNAGFLRPDSATAIFFVADENDCSHDGTLREDTACGGDVCEFENAVAQPDSALVPVTSLKAELVSNLSASKGGTVDEREIWVGSIHGATQPFSGPRPTDAECGDQSYEGLTPSCATSLGIAYSGDRYQRFIQQFQDGNYFPGDQGPNAWICQGDFAPALGEMGTWLGGALAE